MADGEEPEKKRRTVEELLAEKIAVDGGCGDTGDWEGHWNHVKKFVEPSEPFTHPDFEPSTEFAYVTQQDYCRVLNQAEMNMQKVEEEREILIVKEHQDLDGTGIRKGHIVIKILNNGQNFENIQLSKVVEFLRDNTHLSITVKNNLFDLVYQLLRVFKADQQNRHIMIRKDTTSNEVVIQAIWEFAITATHDQYSLCEVSVTPERVIKQRRLPDQSSKLANRMRLSGRYTLSHGFLSPP